MKKSCKIFYGMGAEQFGEGLNPLRGATNDVFALSDIFKEAGWFVRPNNGNDKDHLQKDIIGLHKQVDWKGCREITICFFFATHGLVHGRETYLVPADTDRDDYDRMINTSELTEWVELCVKGFEQCKTRCLFIIDACREDAGRGARAANDPQVSDYVYRGLSTKLKVIKGLYPVFWYSCSQDAGGMAQEIIIPKGGYRGLFSFKLEEVLREGRSRNLNDLAEMVNKKVRQASQMHQQPVLATARGIDEFKFDFSMCGQSPELKPGAADQKYKQYREEAEQLFLKGDYNRAIDVFNKAFELASNRSEKHDLLIWKGRAFKHKKSYEAALECFEESLQYTDKEDFKTWYHIGSTKRLCGKLKEAEEILSGLLKREGNDPYVLFNLGRLADRYDNTEYAIEYYEAVLKNDSKFEFRSSIKRDLNRLKKAIQKKKKTTRRKTEGRRKTQASRANMRPPAIGEDVSKIIRCIPDIFFSGLFIFILGAGLIIGCVGVYKVYFVGRPVQVKESNVPKIPLLASLPDGGDQKATTWEVVNSRWVRNHYPDGAITMSDKATGLMWVYDADENGKAFWQAANDRCETLHYAGYNDWTLPDKEQLTALYMHKGLFKDVRDSIWDSFPGTPMYWTRTTRYDEFLREYDDNYKHTVKMGQNGNIYHGWFEGENHWIWPCREQK